MTWREKVIEQMKKRGMNQKQLSAKSGITEASVSRYLKGDREPRVDVIVNFARALDVKADFLLEGDDSLSLSSYDEISTAIARNGKNLSAEEKNKLITMILGKGV